MSACGRKNDPRSGTILIVTMWIVFVIAGLVLAFAHEMRGEFLISANQTAAIQASAVERGAEQYAIALIAEQKDAVLTLNEISFRAIQLEGGYFWILRPNYGDLQLPSFGLVDEASKVNINTASSGTLQALPGMTAEIAGAIQDWRDADSDASVDGAEDETYLALPQPYHAKNGPLETVEEVLLVRGMTSDLLYGTGTGSGQGSAVAWASGAGGGMTRNASALSDPQLARGIYDYLTIYSSESNTGADGQSRIDVNEQDSSRLSQLLSDKLGAGRAEDIRISAPPRPPFRNIFDFSARARLTQKEFESIADSITTGRGGTQRGLININTAPRDALLTLSGLDESDVTSIISRRNGTSAGDTSIAWVAEVLGPKAVAIGSLITGRSYQYSADILAVSANGRSYKRCRVVVDAAKTPPQVVYRADLTGRGWPLAPEILLSLRAGSGLTASATSGNRGAF